MATLKEYFDADFSHTVSLNRTLEFKVTDLGDIPIDTRIHLDFFTKAMFASFYIPRSDLSIKQLVEIIEAIDTLWQKGWPSPENIRLVSLKLYPGALKISNNPFFIESTFFGGTTTKHDELLFSGRLYLYKDSEFTLADQIKLKALLKNKNLDPQIRGHDFAKMCDKIQIPLAFISHDSQDKGSIAKPIALGLQKLLVPVWYDEFSLTVGSKLRESIEAGIKQCKKCILIVTKSFLSNEGWTKAEFDSVFTKEIVEKGNVILPIWHQVTQREVYEYSPWLANIYAIDWKLGEEEVVNKLHREIIK